MLIEECQLFNSSANSWKLSPIVSKHAFLWIFIFTYQKYEYDGLIDGVNTKLIEYDGIYNINNQFIKKGRNNILKFLVDMMEENLEIKLTLV